MVRSLLLFALLSAVSASALISYTYPNGNCSSTPSYGSYLPLNFCIATGVTSNLITVSGNLALINTYNTPNCTGLVTNSDSRILNNCTLLVTGSLSTMDTVSSSFTPVPTGNDNVTQTFTGSTLCTGTPTSFDVFYGVGGCSNTPTCVISDLNGSNKSSNRVCGDKAVFPKEDITSITRSHKTTPGTAASAASAIFVILAALLLSI